MSSRSAGLHELHAVTSLKRVLFFEIAASRSKAKVPREKLLKIEVEPEYELAVDPGDDSRAFRLRLRVGAETAVGRFVVEAGAEFECPEYGRELEQALLVEYANEIGVMVLLPYVRQAIADITQRVHGTPLLMPIMTRGEIHFDVANPVKPNVGAAPATTSDSSEAKALRKSRAHRD